MATVIDRPEDRRRDRAGAPAGYRWVHLWHLPIRIMHWAAAGSVLLLILTGFYIGKPYFLSASPESPFVMGWMRFLHFAAAGVLVATAIVRIYWLFVGNRYERWKALFPVRPRDWVNLARTVRNYLLIRPHAGPHYLGHNPIQQLSYTGLYLVAGFMVVTGFALYGLHDPGGVIHSLFGWVGTLFGGAQNVRFWHHVVTWAFVIFIPLHIYLSLRADVMEKEAMISSIFSGGKFVREDAEFEDE